jgi:hypothetical protein
MNIIDMLAIIPFYLSLLLEGLEDLEIIGKAGKFVRLVKVTKKSEKERTVFYRFCFFTRHSDLKGHGNEADFLGVLRKPVRHGSLTLRFEPFRVLLKILRRYS